MKIHQHLCDYKYRNCYSVIYDEDTNEVLEFSIDTNSAGMPACIYGDYQNTLYYYYDYETAENRTKDIVWISDDNKIVEIDDVYMKHVKSTQIFDKLRELKTRDKILSYLNYLEL